jgi:recombination protein RecT
MENQNNQVVAKPNTSTIKGFFEQSAVKNRFTEMLGKRSNQFISSVLQITANNSMLKNADPLSVYNAALMAATLDLPINQNLGFAWIVPYGKQAQFQMGFKGYVQLAQRTGQYTSINVIEVHENQFVSFNTLTEEFNADFSVEGNGKIVGYAAYFKLVNGFEKTCYWTTEKVMAHGKRYSKTFTNGPWKTDFDAMAKKTVLKSTLSKWGILSIEMQQALKVDQSVIKDEAGDEVQYVDHEEIKVNPEVERLRTLIENATTTDELEKYGQLIPEELSQTYQEKYMELMPSEK